MSTVVNVHVLAPGKTANNEDNVSESTDEGMLGDGGRQEIFQL